MVIDLLLQESVVVIIDFVDILRSSISTERMVHGHGEQLDDRGGECMVRRGHSELWPIIPI